MRRFRERYSLRREQRGVVITEVAQKVQRSAFPNAYGFHEPAARAFASGLSGRLQLFGSSLGRLPAVIFQSCVKLHRT